MAFRYRHGDRPLDGYTILRGIGQGGFGEVYYAVSDGGREVALKAIQQNQEIELRGVKACMNLKSPHLVTIFDVREDTDGYPYVIMEHVEGPSLRDITRPSPSGIGMAKAAYLVREMGRGLAYLHEHGIVHRDLKPENIFFEDGYVKIGDYGLSKYISVSHQSGQTISVGTVHYMAPEIGSGNYQRSIDIYALGVILYELLTGQVPFNGDSMGEILMKHLSCEPDLEPIDPGVRPIIAKALAKRPEDRFERVEDMIEALLEVESVHEALHSFEPTSFASYSGAGKGAAEPGLGAIETKLPNLTDPTVEGAALEGAETRVEATAPVEATAREEETARASRPPDSGNVHRPAVPPTPTAEPRPEPVKPDGIFSGTDLDQRIVVALLTAAAMSLALWLLSGGRSFRDSVLGSSPIDEAALMGGAILAATIPLLVVEGWLVPRFRLEKGLVHRLASFALAGPPLALAMVTMSGAAARSVPASLVGLFLIDWQARTEPQRPERISIQQAFTAGILGFVLGTVTRGQPILCAGVLAAVSLVLNAIAPYRARKPFRKAPTGATTSPDPRASAPKAHPVAHPAAPPAAPPAATAPAPLRPAAPGPLLTAAVPGPTPPNFPGPPSRLVRTRDALLAGVCGGIAARYAVDVAWVRFAFLTVFLCTMGWGLIAYLAMWVCMPGAERAAAALAGNGGLGATPRERGPVARFVWYLVAAVTAVFSVLSTIAVADHVANCWRAGHNHALLRDEQAGWIGLSALGVLFAGLAFLKGRSKRKHSLWRGTLQPLLAIVCLSAAAGFTACLPAHFGRDEFFVAAAAAIGSGLLGVFGAVHSFRWHRSQPVVIAAPKVRVPYRPDPGWHVLGTLLVVLAFGTLAIGTLLHAASAEQFGLNFFEAPRLRVTAMEWTDFTLVVTAFFFVPGVLCLGMARRTGGLLHVLRGIVGLVLLGFLGLLLAIGTSHMVYGHGPFSMENALLTGLVLGVPGGILIAWPAKGMPLPPVAAVRPERSVA